MKKDRAQDTAHAAVLVYEYMFFLIQACRINEKYGRIFRKEPYSEDLQTLLYSLEGNNASFSASPARMVANIFSKMRGEEFLPFGYGTFSDCEQSTLRMCRKENIPVYHVVRESRQDFLDGMWAYSGEPELALREVNGIVELPVSALMFKNRM